MFIALIQEERGKVEPLRAIWREAELGKTEIVTSVFTFTEVVRVKCELGVSKPLPEEQDLPIEDLLRAKWVIRVLLDEEIGKSARRLLRQYPQCKKPSDGIHLATALRMSVDEMHTYDGSDLLKLSGMVLKKDSFFLKICRPKPLIEAGALPSSPAGQLLLGENGS